VLERIFGSEREKVTGGWRELRNEERHNLSSLPNLLKMIKYSRIRLAYVTYGRNKKLTSWRIVLLEKLIVAQLVEKFPSVFGTRMFIAVQTRNPIRDEKCSHDFSSKT
jgi:hypothetical protein